MKAFFVACAASLSLLACGGIEGPPGPQGPQGPQGIPGEDGSGLKSVLTCNAVRQIGTHKLAFNSVRYGFEDGSTMVTCIVNDAFASYSSSLLFREADSGAALGSCLVVYDLDSGSEGYFQFSALESGTGSAKYVDPSSTFDNYGIPMSCVRR